MIDNFAPQPFPLEASTDGGETWRLVLGWQRANGTAEVIPVFASDDLGSPRYRPSAPPTSTARVSPAAEAIRAPVARPPRRPQAT